MGSHWPVYEEAAEIDPAAWEGLMNKVKFRSERLTQLARGKPCMLQIPDVCNGNEETTVAAHANWQEYGKGGSTKAHDCFTAWACSACHFEIDQGSKLTREERKDYWLTGFIRTTLYLWLNKLVRVA